MKAWKCALVLDAQRRRVDGSEQALAEAVGRGADLRINTEFVHNEHVDVRSDNDERVREVAEFGVTYLLRGSWVAGIMSLRQPVNPPVSFGPRPSMSFFLYNQDGQQAIARPFLDGAPAKGTRGPSAPDISPDMPKYHAQNSWDRETNAPSTNFIYDFDVYRYYVRDEWQEVFAHDCEGRVQSGSIGALTDAFSAGCEVKAGVRGLCGSLAGEAGSAPEHELFVQAGSCYFATRRVIFSAGTHPVIRVRPRIPLLYESGNWDFGWLMLRTDGFVIYRRCDPYTLAFSDIEGRHAIRWFIR